MSKGLTGLEWHKGEKLMTIFIFENPFIFENQLSL